MKISNIKLEILSYVVENPCTLEELAYDYGLITFRDAVVAQSFELFQEGFIKAVRWVGEEEEKIEQEFIPTLEEINLNINTDIEERLHFLYFLTPKGIQLWEEVAQPKWSQYFKWFTLCSTSHDEMVSWGYPNLEKYEGERDYVQITCIDKEILDKFLLVIPYLEHSKEIMTGTEMWDVVTPWHINYWKTVPMAHRLLFQFTNEHFNYVEKEDLKGEQKEAREWYEEIRNWHIRATVDNILD
jgi:hypothetical protein